MRIGGGWEGGRQGEREGGREGGREDLTIPKGRAHRGSLHLQQERHHYH